MNVRPKLMVRIDEFSWQGVCEEDPRLYFRRLRLPEDGDFTDVLVGGLDLMVVKRLLAEFIHRTGPLSTSEVRATDIAIGSKSKEVALARFQEIVSVLTAALLANNYIVASSYIDLRDGKYIAYLELE